MVHLALAYRISTVRGKKVARYGLPPSRFHWAHAHA